MIATLSLMSCVLATAQPADGAEWLLVPRLTRAQELVYRGSFDEQANGSEVQYSRSYRLRTVAFILDASPQGAEAAFLTILRPHHSRTAAVDDATPTSVRLEVGRVHPQGRVTAHPASLLAVPVEGPPTVETGAFVEVPRHRIGARARWVVDEEGRPSRTWTVAGTETVNATTCVKLTGVQQTDDWERPRADRPAWRRLDTVWIAPRLGIAYKVERVVERRDPARQDATYRSVLRYELDQRTEYPRAIGDDIRREINQARTFAERCAPLLPHPTKNLAQIEALLAQIKYHQEHYPAPPPYGEAMLHLQRRLQAARRGEAAPTPPPERTDSPAVAAVGRPAPDFVIPDLTSNESARLRRWKGKPILMAFYHPKSLYADEVLRLAQEVADAGKGQVVVLGMAMSADGNLVRKQRSQLGLSFPILDGSALRQSYAVEATPSLMVIDAEGILRSTQVGWGSETRSTVFRDLKLQRPSAIPASRKK
jgi:peroxiredoxin